MDKERVGIGILAYYGAETLEACLLSLISTIDTKDPRFSIYVWDNSDWDMKNMKIVKSIIPTATCRIGHNVGCAIPRNFFYFKFRSEFPYLLIADQDVVFLDGWLDKLLCVMKKHDDAGVATFPVCNLGGSPLLTPDGQVAECSSVCYLHRVRAMDTVASISPLGTPYDSRFFMYRFETLFCAWMKKAGWKVFLDLSDFDPEKPMTEQSGGILHIAPHEGIRRNKKWRDYYAISKELYRDTIVQYGLEDPLKERAKMWTSF